MSILNQFIDFPLYTFQNLVLTISSEIDELNDIAALMHFSICDFTFIYTLVECCYIVHHQKSQRSIWFRTPIRPENKFVFKT